MSIVMSLPAFSIWFFLFAEEVEDVRKRLDAEMEELLKQEKENGRNGEG